MKNLRKQLTISRNRLDEINQVLADPKNPLVNGLLEIGSGSRSHPMWPTCTGSRTRSVKNTS